MIDALVFFAQAFVVLTIISVVGAAAQWVWTRIGGR